MQFSLALWVIKFLPPDHNSKKPTSLGTFGSETIFLNDPLPVSILRPINQIVSSEMIVSKNSSLMRFVISRSTQWPWHLIVNLHEKVLSWLTQTNSYLFETMQSFGFIPLFMEPTHQRHYSELYLIRLVLVKDP